MYGKIGECSGEREANSTIPEPPKMSEKNPSEGVFVEPPKLPPKKAVWVEKPNHLRNKLDTLPDMARKNPPPKPKVRTKPRVNPQPKVFPQP